jgi:hypothetical protein
MGKPCPPGVKPVGLAKTSPNFGCTVKCPKGVDPKRLRAGDANFGCKVSLLDKVKGAATKLKDKVLGKACPIGVDPTTLEQGDTNFGCYKKCPKGVDPDTLEEDDENFGCKTSLMSKIKGAASKVTMDDAMAGAQLLQNAPGMVKNFKGQAKATLNAFTGKGPPPGAYGGGE